MTKSEIKEIVREVLRGEYQQPKNVTVNIKSIETRLGIDKVRGAIAKEASATVEKAVKEMMVKAVRDSEITLGS